MDAFRKVLGDRVLYFPTPDFSDTSPGFGERMAEDLERKVDAGASGLKIFKEFGLRHRDAGDNLIPVDDPRLDPLWARAGELGVPVLIHTADPVAFFQPLDENNERWEELQLHPNWHFGRPGFPDHDTLLAQRNRVIERHPDTTFIGAHLGNYPENLTYVDACLDRYPNFYVDTCARIGEIGRHPVHEVRAFFLKHQDRVIFGTDLVLGWGEFEEQDQEDLSEVKRFYDAHWRFFETGEQQIEYPGFPIQGGWKVDAIPLPDAVLEKLYVRNVQRLIPGLREQAW
jgi:predicted TIM-barrel fold metal-dependent hydrolase